MSIIHDSAAALCRTGRAALPGCHELGPCRVAPSLLRWILSPMTDSFSGSAAPRPPIAWADAERERAFGRWFDELAPRHRLDRGTLHLASADASSRRYFRVAGPDGRSYIVMDSPAAEDSVAAFVHIGGLVRGAGLNGPRVLEQDLHQGFLLLDDLGDTQYLAALREPEPLATQGNY